MDRLGFLSSMPFLVPTHSLPRSSSSGSGRKIESLIAPQESYQFKVSLEPIVTGGGCPEEEGEGEEQQCKYDSGQQPPNLQEIQPAFFIRPPAHNNNGDGGAKQGVQTDFDPAMANIQVVLESPAVSNNHMEEHHSSHQDDPSVLQGRVLFGGKQQQQQPGSSSSTSTSATPSSHRNTTNRHLQQIQTPTLMGDPAAGPTLMFFKIDEGVFQVDGRHLMRMELRQPNNGSKSEQESHQPRLPPSLLLVFPCCVFRIFPLRSPNNPASSAYADTQQKKEDGCWSQQALEALKLLEKRLVQLPYHSAQAAAAAAAWSPTSSSVQTSSNEAGQKETTGGQQPQSHSHSTLASSGSSSRGTKHNNNKKLKGNNAAAATNAVEEYDHTLFQDNHQIRKVKRRRDALWRSRVGLQAVETILEMPLSVYTPDTTLVNLVPTLSLSTTSATNKATTTNMTTDSAVSAEGAEPRTQVHGNNNNNNNNSNNLPLAEDSDPSSTTSVPVMGPLLGGVAEEMTNAYGTAQETSDVMQLYQREIEETRNERLDSLLNSFFPEKRHASSKSRRRQYYSSKSAKRSSNNKHGASSNHNGDDDDGGDGGGAAEEMKPVEEVMASMQMLIQKQKELVEDRSSFLMLPTRG